MRIYLLPIFILTTSFVLAQGFYAPPAGQIGSTAMHRDSSSFVAWCTQATINRGWQDISNTSLGLTTVGDNISPTGFSGLNGVVSLGDGGSATLTFEGSIYNGVGADFAVFENGFDAFLELAFVEVSSDGINFFRFPAYSETNTETQTDGFGSTDATNIHNLAGKYVNSYGTPFDLEDLQGIGGLNIDAISHVKIIDVVGAINPLYATYDYLGRAINDPYPTPFPSSGFDLDAVGVIHLIPTGIEENTSQEISVYPNPFKETININNLNNDYNSFTLINVNGQIVTQSLLTKSITTISTEELPKGVYFIEFKSNSSRKLDKLIKY